MERMALIDSIEFISDLRREFYKTILKERFEKILLKSYNSLQYGDKVIVDTLEAMRRTKINSRSTFYRKLKRVQ